MRQEREKCKGGLMKFHFSILISGYYRFNVYRMLFMSKAVYILGELHALCVE